MWPQETRFESNRAKSFEILEWLNRATLDIIGAAAFGVEFESMTHPEMPIRKAYQSIFQFDVRSRLFHAAASVYPVPKYLPLKTNFDFAEARGILLEKAGDIISDKYGKTHTTNKDIIVLIVKENTKRANDGEDELSFEVIRDQVLTFIGAGHDTIATEVA